MIALAVILAAGSGRPPGPQHTIEQVRELVLVDSAGRPAARIRWDRGQLNFVIPRRAGHRAVSSVMVGDSGAVVIGRGGGRAGTQLQLRQGQSNPSLVLSDGDGNEIARLGAPSAQPAGY